MSELPEPDNWRDRPIAFVFGLLLFGASAVVATAWTVDRLQRGEYLTAAITAGGAVFGFCFGLATVLRRFRPTTLRGTADATHGTTLLPDRVSAWLAAIALAAAVPSGLLYVTYVPQGRVDLPLSPGQKIFSPILIGAIVVIAAIGLCSMARRRGNGHIRLAEREFEFADVMFRQRGSWADVTDISDVTPGKQQAPQPIVFVMKEARPIVIKNADGYGPDGAALYWMVRHYWKHPEDRAELGDGRALERLRDKQFAAE